MITEAEFAAFLDEMDPHLDAAQAKIGQMYEQTARRGGRKEKRDPTQAEIKRAIAADAKVAAGWKKWGEGK